MKMPAIRAGVFKSAGDLCHPGSLNVSRMADASAEGKKHLAALRIDAMRMIQML
jgi:hypothetical protein